MISTNKAAIVCITMLRSMALYAQAPEQAPAFSAQDANGKTHTL